MRRAAALAAASLVALAVASSAAAATVDQTIPFAMTVTNPCNGDVVAVTGFMHEVMVTSSQKAEIQTNWPDTAGVATNGTLYQANDANHFYVISAPGDAFTVGLTDSFELVSQSGTSNFLVHVTIKIIFDPTSGVDTKITGAGADCSGPGSVPL